MRRPHLVMFLALVALGSAPVYGVVPGSISGVVLDSQGVPQIGAVVELLRPDLSVIASVFTNSTGHYKLPSVLPGRYAVKAMGTAFLPSLREDVRVRSSAVVNLTLNTLYEVMHGCRRSRDRAMRNRTTGSGLCAQRPTVRCCAGWKTGRWWWCRTGLADHPN